MLLNPSVLELYTLLHPHSLVARGFVYRLRARGVIFTPDPERIVEQLVGQGGTECGAAI